MCLFGNGKKEINVLVTTTANSSPCLLTNYNGITPLKKTCGKQYVFNLVIPNTCFLGYISIRAKTQKKEILVTEA
jgi:hypothetical protein